MHYTGNSQTRLFETLFSLVHKLDEGFFLWIFNPWMRIVSDGQILWLEKKCDQSLQYKRGLNVNKESQEVSLYQVCGGWMGVCSA